MVHIYLDCLISSCAEGRIIWKAICHAVPLLYHKARKLTQKIPNEKSTWKITSYFISIKYTHFFAFWSIFIGNLTIFNYI